MCGLRPQDRAEEIQGWQRGLMLISLLLRGFHVMSLGYNNLKTRPAKGATHAKTTH
jgi:hypothetical protein